jgi:hypothetical protein
MNVEHTQTSYLEDILQATFALDDLVDLYRRYRALVVAAIRAQLESVGIYYDADAVERYMQTLCEAYDEIETFLDDALECDGLLSLDEALDELDYDDLGILDFVSGEEWA